MSLQCLLGLICDPVAGLVQVPCLARNMAGVSIAATAAECVCSGFDVVIPLDEMTPIMFASELKYQIISAFAQTDAALRRREKD